MKSPRSTSVPRSMQASYDAIGALTDRFCPDYTIWTQVGFRYIYQKRCVNMS